VTGRGEGAGVWEGGVGGGKKKLNQKKRIDFWEWRPSFFCITEYEEKQTGRKETF